MFGIRPRCSSFRLDLFSIRQLFLRLILENCPTENKKKVNPIRIKWGIRPFPGGHSWDLESQDWTRPSQWTVLVHSDSCGGIALGIDLTIRVNGPKQSIDSVWPSPGSPEPIS